MAPCEFRTDEFIQASKQVFSYDNYVICGHVNPDADCIGAQSALRLALEKCGKNVTCLLADTEEVDRTLKFLPKSDEFVAAKNFVPADDADAPYCFIAVDVPSLRRLGPDIDAAIEGAETSIVIDHHNPEALEADLKLIFPDSAAASLVVWEICSVMNLLEDEPDIALCTLCGLISDTGSFRYQNADTHAFSAAASMVSHGADPNIIAINLYQSRTLASLGLERRTIEHMYLDEENRFAVSYLCADDFKECHASKMDADSMVDLLRALGCVDVVCMLRQLTPGSVINGSLRSKTEKDVSKIAGQFNGGGHRAAAGFTLEDKNLEQAFCLLKSIMLDFMTE